MKRTKLCDRQLPRYSRGEEIMNMVTHIVGGGFAVCALVLSILKALQTGGGARLFSAIIYGVTMIATYAVSSIYHGLKSVPAKKVMQVIDHCCIYFLIAGTYTPIMVCSFIPQFPAIGWGILTLQWSLTAVAVTLTAIDLKKCRVFSMICYIFLGWAVIFFVPQALQVMGAVGFGWLLAGGIAYTVGAILFGLGSKLRWMHSVFHIFVIMGSLLQLVSILLVVL